MDVEHCEDSGKYDDVWLDHWESPFSGYVYQLEAPGNSDAGYYYLYTVDPKGNCSPSKLKWVMPENGPKIPMWPTSVFGKLRS